MGHETGQHENIEAAGAVPGIKVDAGAKAMALDPDQTVTEGLDGLRERFVEYHRLGARFAKWRATYNPTKPSWNSINANAHAWARRLRRPLSFWCLRKRQASSMSTWRTRLLPALTSPCSRRRLPLSSGEPVSPASRAIARRSRTWHQATNCPTRRGQLDYNDQRAILLKGGEGMAEAIELQHLGLSYRCGLRTRY